MAVATDIDDAVHLLAQHFVYNAVHELRALLQILGTISVSLEKAQITQNIVISGFVAGSRNAIDDFRRIEHG
ncbi:hypothetical protein SDC9_98233 [bioreactor metagenome]|uniref:Uncharacterized protein n=1 Tax=bioreactor metagenome TaxID=1076179 RepID=A0A645APE9_9ZZZZ